MYYIYILQSQTHPSEIYTGYTSDLKRRLLEHNSGKSAHTSKFKPWKLIAYIALPEKNLAEKLERYLESGSGRAFALRHLQKPKS
jgi:predicted GIY-YIG superfamily endonuclease